MKRKSPDEGEKKEKPRKNEAKEKGVATLDPRPRKRKKGENPRARF